MSIKQKLTAGVATAAMMAGVLTTGAHAASNVTINHNGAGSKNVVAKFDVKVTNVVQGNSTTANTTVVSKNNTGKNKSNFNVGGTSSITTGAATSTTTVTTTGGSNTAAVAGCGCPTGDSTIAVNNNGAHSTNVVLGGSFTFMGVTQVNSTSANTTVVSANNTGGNSSSFNVGTGSTQTTGGATTTTTVTTTGGDNTAVVTP